MDDLTPSAGGPARLERHGWRRPPARDLSMKLRTTSDGTSASSNAGAPRASRASTSASESEPRPVTDRDAPSRPTDVEHAGCPSSRFCRRCLATVVIPPPPGAALSAPTGPGETSYVPRRLNARRHSKQIAPEGAQRCRALPRSQTGRRDEKKHPSMNGRVKSPASAKSQGNSPETGDFWAPPAHGQPNPLPIPFF